MNGRPTLCAKEKKVSGSEIQEKPKLNDEKQYPESDIIRAELGDSFKAYKMLLSALESSDINLKQEWKYYTDGKSWLCKVTNKAKTIFWLSVWEGYFKAGFYFTEKTGSGINELAISESIKADFKACKNIGKLKPLTLDISKDDQIHDLIEIIKYKIKS